MVTAEDKVYVFEARMTYDDLLEALSLTATVTVLKNRITEVQQ